MEPEHLKEYVDYLKNTKGLGDIALYRYAQVLKNLDLENLTQDSLNAHAQKKRNDSVVRGAILNLLEMTRLNKVFDMPPKSSGRKRVRKIRPISNEEIKIIRTHLYSKSFRQGLIFDLIYEGALRRAEVIPIRLNSFKWLRWFQDMDKPCHLIIKGKGDKERIVMINPHIAERIFNHYNVKYGLDEEDRLNNFINNPSLLLTIEGRPLTNKYIWRTIHFGSLDSIGRAIRPHELRHQKATNLEKIGVPIKDIKVYLGHANLSTTELYLHIDEAESLKHIEEILSKKGG